jgi:hypothetical protein
MFEANDDSPRAQRNQLAECLADEPLRAGHAGPLGVRRVAEQQVDAAAPELCERPDIGLEPVDGRVVELPVPGVEDPPRVGLDDDGHRVGDRVGDTHELQVERPQREGLLPRLDLGEDRRRAESVLVELRLHERERQPRADHLADLERAQRVRQPADVVLVAVRDHDRADRPTLEIRDIRQHQVDAEVLVPREREAGLDHDPVVAVLEHGHVLPDFAEPAERDDSEWRHRRSLRTASPDHAAVRYATVVSRPRRSRRPRIAAVSVSSASTSGSRRPPTSWPRS